MYSDPLGKIEDRAIRIDPILYADGLLPHVKEESTTSAHLGQATARGLTAPGKAPKRRIFRS